MACKVLVTGATGFLGSNVARRCVNNGFETHILTRKSSNSWRINDILPNFQVHNCDLSDYNTLEEIMQTVKPEIIFHFAAYGTHLGFQTDVAEIIQGNFIGSVNLIKAAKSIDYSILINVGSSSEYGQKTAAMAENDLLEPMSLYAITKAASTHYAQFIAKSNGKPIVTVRPFSVYGYYEQPIRLIPATIWHCLKGKDMQLSDGKNAMDFLFVEDAVDACMGLIDNSSVSGEVINLGTGTSHTVKEVVQKIVTITQSSINLHWGSLSSPKHAPTLWVADTVKMQKVLKWKPRYTLDAGLLKTITWMKENIHLYRRFETMERQ